MRSPFLLACLWAPAGCIEYQAGPQGDTQEEPLPVVETFVQTAAPMLDVLWIVDDTRSMLEEQEALALSLPTFVSRVEEHHIAYQFGVVTTDTSAPDAARLRGNPWIITPSLADPVAAFAAAIQVGVGGSGAEAGLGAMILALSEPLRSGYNRGFRRMGATLHVVVVSDSDDASDALLGTDPVEMAVDFLEEEADRSQAGVRFSAIAGAPPLGCSGENGSALSADRYAQVTEAMGGVLASICEGDLHDVASALAEGSVLFPDTFPLQAPARSDTVTVEVDGRRQTSGWTYEASPPAIVFSQAPAADSVIQVRYRLATEEG